MDNMTEVRKNVWHAPAASGETLIVERFTERDADSQYVVTRFTPTTGHFLIADGVSQSDAVASVARRV